MKKTLITLLSLAGMAMAATDGYLTNPDALTWDDALTLTTPANGVLDSSNSAISWSEDTDNLTASWELGFTVTSSTVGERQIFGTNGTGGANGVVLEIRADGALSLQFGQNNDQVLAITSAGVITANTGTTVTLTFVNYVDEVTGSDAAGGLFTMTVAGTSYTAELSAAQESHTTFLKNGATRFWTNGGVDKISNISLKTGGNMIIPEPATATLSLLALAGLAARRRRK